MKNQAFHYGVKPLIQSICFYIIKPETKNAYCDWNLISVYKCDTSLESWRHTDSKNQKIILGWPSWVIFIGRLTEPLKNVTLYLQIIQSKMASGFQHFQLRHRIQLLICFKKHLCAFIPSPAQTLPIHIHPFAEESILLKFEDFDYHAFRVIPKK